MTASESARPADDGLRAAGRRLPYCPVGPGRSAAAEQGFSTCRRHRRNEEMPRQARKSTRRAHDGAQKGPATERRERMEISTVGSVHRSCPAVPARLRTLLRAMHKMWLRSHGLRRATGRDACQPTGHDVTQEQPDQALEMGMWRGDEI